MAVRVRLYRPERDVSVFHIDRNRLSEERAPRRTLALNEPEFLALCEYVDLLRAPGQVLHAAWQQYHDPKYCWDACVQANKHSELCPYTKRQQRLAHHAARIAREAEKEVS